MAAVDAVPADEARQVGVDRAFEADLALGDQFQLDHGGEGLGVAADPDLPVVGHLRSGDVTAALSAGAGGFVLKCRPVRQIAEAVRVVAAGEAIRFPTALRRMVTARPLDSTTALPRAALTGREEEVLRSMATGLSNPEIAQSLRVSLETVKTHVGNVLTKLGAQNRTHAVVIAYESGLVVPRFAD
ncbi:DNA-binding response regulator [Streptomyces sp. NPDC101733]|uniref:response regulator transcription factor n=1 Tax=unclassified Streptomyces TaxID=2593676 RepID=UPI0038226C4D